MPNAYPPWWSETITVYNRFFDSKNKNQVIWQRHIIEGCFFSRKFTQEKSEITVSEGSEYLVRIPERESFYLREGDIIVRGTVFDVIDEYVKNRRASDLLELYKDSGAFIVSAVKKCSYFGVPVPHYYCRGGNMM